MLSSSVCANVRFVVFRKFALFWGLQLIRCSISQEKISFLEALFRMMETAKVSPSIVYSYSVLRNEGARKRTIPKPITRIKRGI